MQAAGEAKDQQGLTGGDRVEVRSHAPAKRRVPGRRVSEYVGRQTLGRINSWQLVKWRVIPRQPGSLHQHITTPEPWIAVIPPGRTVFPLTASIRS